MLENAAGCGQRQIFLGVGHRDLARLARVFELVVRAHHVHQIPAVGLDSLDDVPAFHGLILRKNTHRNPSVDSLIDGLDGKNLALAG